MWKIDASFLPLNQQGFTTDCTLPTGEKVLRFTPYYKKELDLFVKGQVRESLKQIELAGFTGIRQEVIDWVSRKCIFFPF